MEKGWTWPTMADNDQADAFLDFGGSGFPFLVMLDTDGTVRGAAARGRHQLGGTHRGREIGEAHVGGLDELRGLHVVRTAFDELVQRHRETREARRQRRARA